MLTLLGEGLGGELLMRNPLTQIAKSLRRNSTNPERKLWAFLRNRRFEGIKFRRQHPISCYIVDFISLEKKLIIEIDGGHHSKQIEKDTEREKCLNLHGYRVIRFWNNDVMDNIQGVLEIIRIHTNPSPPPTPPPREGTLKTIK